MSFDNMGKPIPNARRAVAYEAAKEMGLPKDEAFGVVQAVAEQLERDKPHEALERGCKSLDLCGAYRLMAHLLVDAGQTPDASVSRSAVR